MKFGSFKYAKSNSPLYGDMQQRHLSEMLGGWKNIGHAIAPAIVKAEDEDSDELTLHSLPIEATISESNLISKTKGIF